MPIRFRGLERAEVLGFNVPVATSFISRLLGLALLRREQAGAGLLIPDCRSVHTLGMQFSLDLVFLDGEHQIVGIRRDLPPRRFVSCEKTVMVLELPSEVGYGCLRRGTFREEEE